MSSNRFLEIVKRIAVRDKALFDTLMEFERTKKIRTKERLNFTIDKSIAIQFKKFCKEKGYNMSAKVEQAIKNIIQQ